MPLLRKKKNSLAMIVTMIFNLLASTTENNYHTPSLVKTSPTIYSKAIGEETLTGNACRNTLNSMAMSQ